jgi:UDP-N-acetylmuramate dehydrogenase
MWFSSLVPEMSTVLPEDYADLCPMRRDECLARWTTLRIGGPAEHFFEPAKPEHLAALLTRLEVDGVPTRLLGAGANVLAPDGGVPGAVIQTGGMRRVFREENCLRLWPGVSNPQLVRSACELGLSGVEKLIGVPGHLGGSLAMNAGAADWGIWDQVDEVTLWLPGGEIVARKRAEMNPLYRDGALMGAVVLEALLSFEPQPVAQIKQRQEEFLRHKNASQPVTLTSAGCAFKNPPGDSAGRLIDAAGLKGSQVGAVVVSDRHANFLVNQGGATAAEVRALLERIEQTVAKKFGIKLVRELQVWPEPVA